MRDVTFRVRPASELQTLANSNRSASPSVSRARNLSSDCFVISLVYGRSQREEEGGAYAHFSLGPHPATVAMDDALHRRQPYSRPLEFARTMQALEGAKELPGVGHIEPDAVVSREVRRGAVGFRNAELDPGPRSCLNAPNKTRWRVR